MPTSIYKKELSDVFSSVQSQKEGLSEKEALRRLEANGKNKLKEKQKTPLWRRFLAELKDPMTLILLAACLVSTVLDVVERAVPYDTFIILFVVLVNAVLGVVQESKAEAAIEALQKMSAATTRVLRDGHITRVKSEDLVVGDVVLLEAGDSIPADCRLLECADLQVEEAALTGESVPAHKDVALPISQDGRDIPLGDRKNMVYMGSIAVYGRGVGLVVATGMDTEMGKIAAAITEAEEGLTPLQKKLAQLSRVLTFAVIGICAFILLFNTVRALVTGTAFADIPFLSFFMVAVSLAVAAIPEGLVAVVTVVLSMGVTHMAEKQAIVRRLTAVETLGCAQIICSDKTGTLTQNKMTVTAHVGDAKEIATAMALCSDAEQDEKGEVVGEPTEAALVYFAASLSLQKNGLKRALPRIAELPFDSKRKMMSTLHQKEDGVVQYTKGAPDVILSRCTAYEQNGEILPLTEEKRAEIALANQKMASDALRVLACAKRLYKSKPAEISSVALEKELVFIGLTGMIDPVRPEVKVAIAQCRSAGITPVMITGDHKDTAVAIAKELGIISHSAQAITGAELEEMDEEAFLARVRDIRVYARVQPEHKTRIVSAWQSLGCVTAMTGDGVNDAPSIKTADIGIGMGITGTDVTKNVADMVLADDNFATIVGAVAEGRRIYDNIRKAIQFLLGSNFAEVLTVFTASLVGVTVLKPTHLLFINLITDTFPALALGVEKAEKDSMQKPPRRSTDGIFAGGLGFDVIYQGALVTVLTLLSYFIGQSTDPSYIKGGESALGITMAFFTMSMCEIFHSLNMRSQRHSIFTVGSSNKILYLAMGASLLFSTLIIEIPFFARLFDFVPTGLDLSHYIISIALALLVIPAVELVKLCQRGLSRKHAEKERL
ncbi:MAG: cation-translocating P-type ATPase [Clostridia bacterium]|nr:cation-translocating P-type ATPase [Clostridia bacterium]